MRGATAATVLAVAGPTARQVSAIATPLARARGTAVHVLHVIETDVLAGEDTADLEKPVQAQTLLDECVAELHEAGVPVTGELLHSYGTHTDVATQILQRAAELHAGAIVLGADTRHPILTTAVTAYVAAHAPTHVIVINPNAGALGRPTPAGTPPAPRVTPGSFPGKAPQRAAEFLTRADPELRVNLPQMPLHGARADIQLRTNLRVGATIAGESRDLPFLGG